MKLMMIEDFKSKTCPFMSEGFLNTKSLRSQFGVLQNIVYRVLITKYRPPLLIHVNFLRDLPSKAVQHKKPGHRLHMPCIKFW